MKASVMTIRPLLVPSLTFLKMSHPRPLFRLLMSFQKTLQFLEKINVKNDYPEY